MPKNKKNAIRKIKSRHRQMRNLEINSGVSMNKLSRDCRERDIKWAPKRIAKLEQQLVDLEKKEAELEKDAALDDKHTELMNQLLDYCNQNGGVLKQTQEIQDLLIGYVPDDLIT